MKRTERQERLASYHKEEATKVVEAFAKLVNHGGGDGARFAIADAFKCEHRTLQQGIWGCIQQIILDLADNTKTGHHDLRNEYASTQAKTIVSALEIIGREEHTRSRFASLESVPLI